ncbi:MAG: hypothetical protein JO327_08675 [Nitrososphaeraceae archaeon]|nr:hypothetical protein [Nitrososphaeraceae archaeon]MBV9668190.1 hypothetical protein [Nitrososphaeraceae archaeon]
MTYILWDGLINVWHKTRGIMYIDKTDNNIKILNVVTKHHLTLLKELYEIVSSSKLYENNKTRRANDENTLIEKKDL